MFVEPKKPPKSRRLPARSYSLSLQNPHLDSLPAKWSYQNTRLDTLPSKGADQVDMAPSRGESLPRGQTLPTSRDVYPKYPTRGETLPKQMSKQIQTSPAKQKRPGVKHKKKTRKENKQYW